MYLSGGDSNPKHIICCTSFDIMNDQLHWQGLELVLKNIRKEHLNEGCFSNTLVILDPPVAKVIPGFKVNQLCIIVFFASLFVLLDIHCWPSAASSTHCWPVSTSSGRVSDTFVFTGQSIKATITIQGAGYQLYSQSVLQRRAKKMGKWIQSKNDKNLFLHQSYFVDLYAL